MMKVTRQGGTRRAYLGLGSNIGDKASNIDEAIARLNAPDGIRVTARSRFYRTAPWGNEDQDWFVNACIAVDTQLEPQPLLDLCLGIEKSMGRQRQQKWGPRLIDIDLLLYEEERTETATLTLPHPCMLQRAFVLVPLHDIAPDIIIDGVHIKDALKTVSREDIVPLK